LRPVRRAFQSFQGLEKRLCEEVRPGRGLVGQILRCRVIAEATLRIPIKANFFHDYLLRQTIDSSRREYMYAELRATEVFGVS
jgi:hypothetical protein